MKNKIILLGASGSIGSQTLNVIEQHPDRLELAAVSVNTRVSYLPQIIRRHHPRMITVGSKEDAERLRAQYPEIEFFYGDEGLVELVRRSEGDLVVNALMGFIGLRPTIEALRQKKQLALANKETLVAGGSLVMRLARENGITIRPIDSEHSAIFQCLQGSRIAQAERLIITASGGALRDLGREQLASVTPEQALAHPNWKMGPKITIDSATMMNKGFEVIEAHWLFGLGYDQIETILHKESTIHSMVEFCDHSVIAQLGVPDIRVAIQYALLYPDRCPSLTKPLDLAKLGTLHFAELSLARYPLLKLAYDIGKKGGNLAAVMNGANEAAVALFLKKKISITRLEELVTAAVRTAEERGMFIADPSEDEIIRSDHFGFRLVKGSVSG